MIKRNYYKYLVFDAGENSMKQVGRVQSSKGNYLKGLHGATIISVTDNYCFDKSVDVLNECFGKEYKG